MWGQCRSQKLKQHHYILKHYHCKVETNTSKAMLHSSACLTASFASTTARRPIISLSAACWRQQCRFYASKPKPARKTQSTAPRTTHAPPIAPIKPRQAPMQSAAASATPSRATNDTYVNPTDLYTHTLAQRQSSTLLYLAPTSNVFPISSLSVSGFALSYGFYHLYDALLVVHPGL